MRYPKNRVGGISLLPKAITFDPTVRFSVSLVFQKLDVQRFPIKPRSVNRSEGLQICDQSQNREVEGKDKIAKSTYPTLVASLKTCANKLQILLWVNSLSFFYISFPKSHQKPFDTSLFSTIKRQCSYILFPLLGLRTLDLRFKGCRCSFLAIIYSLCFILLHNMLYCFSQLFLA